jgi:hypothetical protein
LLDRLNTRNLLGRKKFHLPNYWCATLECQPEETLIHLFWNCPCAAKCWDSICPEWLQNLSVLKSIADMREKLNKPFSLEIIILASWSIWIVRNNKIFRNETARWSSWKAIFNQEIHMLTFWMKKKVSKEFKSWARSQHNHDPG